MPMPSRKRGLRGFTLAEMAIVVAMVGLVIAGVIKGQEMIQNAKMTATIAQVHSYKVALKTFRDKYYALPGDFSRALTKIPGCTSSVNCENGNGNGFVDDTAGNKGANTVWTSVVGYSNGFREPMQVWKHLALTSLISGVSTNAAGTAPAWGRTHPSSPMGGGFEFFHDTQTTIQLEGLWLRLSNNGITGGPVGNVNEGPVLRARDAAFIDRKMDDGHPAKGEVLANYGSTTDNCKVSDGVGTGYEATIYNEDDSRKTCVLFWFF